MKAKTWVWALLTTAFMALVAALTGCAEPQVRYVEIKVPVATPCPEPPVLLWPELPTKKLTKTSTDAEVVKAYVATIWILRGRLAEALALLNGYRMQTTPTPIPGVIP